MTPQLPLAIPAETFGTLPALRTHADVFEEERASFLRAIDGIERDVASLDPSVLATDALRAAVESLEVHVGREIEALRRDHTRGAARVQREKLAVRRVLLHAQAMLASLDRLIAA